jgi:hypothetical protein
MMKKPNQSQQGIITGLILCAILMLAGLWAVNHFGPRPAGNKSDQEATNDQAQASLAIGKTLPPAINSNSLTAFFRGVEAPIANGQVNVSVKQHLDSLEALYQRRGYRKFERAANATMTRQQISKMGGKFFWRFEDGSSGGVGAFGNDANPTAETSDANNQIYITMVRSAENGFTQWDTYRHTPGAAKASSLPAFLLNKESDWPGQDPRDVPRPSGLWRRLSFSRPGVVGNSEVAIYETMLKSEAVRDSYTAVMSQAGWRFDPEATKQAGELLHGALCFSRGSRSSWVWVGNGKNGGFTSVVVSSTLQ